MPTVIKAGEAGPILRRLSTVDLADHLSEAHAVIAEAKRQAVGIVAESQRAAERALEEARESGYEAGYQRGYTEGKEAGHQAAHRESIEQFNQRHAAIVEVMQGTVTGIEAMKEDLRTAAEKDLLDLAVAIAGKLTFAIGRVHRESALANLRRALRLVASQTDLTIRVHPDDIASIETFADSALKQAGGSRVVSIVADDSLAPGGCKVQTDRTEIDAALETQVSEMA